MKNKVKIGVMGCADIAGRLVIPNLLQTGAFELVAVASRQADKAIAFGKKFNCEAVTGYDNLLQRDDIDAVYIPLPTGLHFEWIMKSLNEGKHVLSEKSLAVNPQETSAIIALATQRKLCVFENFMFVFHSQFDFVKQRIAEDAIGEVRLLRATFGFPPFSIDTNIRYKQELAGGALMDAGAYTTMAAQFFLGRDQAVLAASLENGNWEVDFQGSALLKNSKGIISQLAFGFDNFYQNNIELWGSKGKLVVERAFTAGPGFMPTIIIETPQSKIAYSLPADNHFQKLLNTFAECIQAENFDFLFDQIICQSSLLNGIKKLAS